ncbi:MAG: diguanylate cyclase [Desulfobacterales bacterium]|nr:diguanylate cyclase [Desulfobacterales bacterium]
MNETRPSVLIVDDNIKNLQILANIFRDRGYKVAMVKAGPKALKFVGKMPPDLILLDIMMPEMDGFEVCRQLKNNSSTKDIPVIFISALTETIDKVKGFKAGGVDYITKPFQSDEVLSRVETHLRLRSLQKDLQKKNIQLEQEVIERKQAEKALKESVGMIERAKKEWESTADSLSYVICLLDDQRRIIRANRTIEELKLGHVIDVKGLDMHELFHPECRDHACYLENLLSNHWNKVAQGESVKCEAWDSLLERYLEVQIQPISGQNDKEYKHSASFAVCIVNDITKRMWAEEVLREHNRELTLLNRMSEQLQKCRAEKETYSVLTNTCSQLFTLDSGCLYMVNDSEKMLELAGTWCGYPSEPRFLEKHDCWAVRRNDIHAVDHPGEGLICPHLNTFPNNGYMCVPIKTSESIMGIISFIFDQCESRQASEKWKQNMESKQILATRVAENYALSLANLRLRERLRKESIHDPLTGLYNRRHMEVSLEREVRRAERHKTSVGIIMLDIDHFKIFNDTYGHEAGDLVLKELGVLLRGSIRGEDIACRYGGEEFLLIMPDTEPGIAEHRAEELLLRVRDLSIKYQDNKLKTTISMGVAAFPNKGGGIKETVNAADAALYKAKRRGRNQVVIASNELE